MFIDAHNFFDFDAELEREAMNQIADGIAPMFDIDVPGERVALLVASDNAGTATSVRFWSDALRTGVAVASPELFPWCLANAPCGALARRFSVTGPNSTMLGEADALFTALDTGEELLMQDRVDTVFIVAVSFVSSGYRGQAMTIRLLRGNDIGHVADIAALCQTDAMLSLRGIIDKLGKQFVEAR